MSVMLIWEGMKKGKRNDFRIWIVALVEFE